MVSIQMAAVAAPGAARKDCNEAMSKDHANHFKRGNIERHQDL